MSKHPRAATKSTNWDSTTADTHSEKRSLNYHSINKPRSLNFPMPLAFIQKLYNLYLYDKNKAQIENKTLSVVIY